MQNNMQQGVPQHMRNQNQSHPQQRGMMNQQHPNQMMGPNQQHDMNETLSDKEIYPGSMHQGHNQMVTTCIPFTYLFI